VKKEDVICSTCDRPFVTKPCGTTHALIARELGGAKPYSKSTIRGLAQRREAKLPSKLPSLRPLGLAHHIYGDDRVAWLVVRDPYAGRQNVYTVYRIMLGGGETRVIGRELPLPHARKIMREDMLKVGWCLIVDRRTRVVPRERAK